MKLGIAFVTIGITLLILAIPYSILGIMKGFAELEQGIVSGGISSYLLIFGVVLGFILIVIGSTRIYFRK